MKTRLCSIRDLAYAVILVLGVVSLGASSLAQQQPRRAPDKDRVLSRMLIPGTGDLQLIVELSDPAVLERIQTMESPRQTEAARLPGERNRRIDFASAPALVHRSQIRRGQESMKRRILDLPGVQVLGTTETLMNSVIVRTPAAHYRAIRRLPGVKKVYFSRPKRMLLDQAAIIQNAPGLWDLAGGQSTAGQGIKIGIIDSGIDYLSGYAGMTAPSGFPKYDLSENRFLTNGKIIVARSRYISLLYNSQKVQSAADELGHGTAVASCAAVGPIQAQLASISGMAPAAYLGNYKVLGTPGINDVTTSAALMAAIDDAVADGMDVINLSFGSLDYLPPEEDVEYAAVKKAIQSGVIVVVAAGNDGPGNYTISSPGNIPEVITVGSVSNSRKLFGILRTGNPDLGTIDYVPSRDGIQMSTDLPLTKIVDVSSLKGTASACSALPPGSLQGSVALAARLGCSETVQVSNAAAAGAIAAILYDDALITYPALTGLSSVTIPAISISNADGLALMKYISQNSDQAKVGIDKPNLATVPGVISSFSSVGPGTDFSIKPDLVAVGENIYVGRRSVLTRDAIYNGTSFSAPMVAGAAADLRSRFRSLEPLGIKSLLMNTASRNLTVDGVNPPNVLEAGNGLLDMGSAMSARTVFSPPSLNFGVHSYSGKLSLSAKLEIRNLASNSDQYTFGLEPIVSGPPISFSRRDSGPVAPGSSTSLEISVDATVSDTGGFQGFVTVTSSLSSFVYRIPYWAGMYVPDSKRVLHVSQNGAGDDSFSSLADAIAAAQPGNVIEIGDNSTYSVGETGLTIGTNRQGLPLHGLTLRAAPGKTPVIRASGFATALKIVGLKNILLQGLRIQAGYTNVDLVQPSPSVALSVTIDQCIIQDADGGPGATGVLIDGGGTIEITKSIIKGSSGTGIVAGLYGAGTQLTLIGTPVQMNRYDGMEAFDTDVHISGSTFSLNTGAGLYLENCTGKVEDSRFTRNQTVGLDFGDGLQIADGKITVQKNVFDLNFEAGIALFPVELDGPGPSLELAGNKITGNYCGIYSGASPYLLADRNLVEDNKSGIYLEKTADALLTNNIIVRSTDPILGDGIKIEKDTNARLINNTIYQNAVNGVLLKAGSVAVVNSIVSSNRFNNLLGVLPASIDSCLIGVDPQFVNPASDDFSLAPDSPAIDAGSNTARDLPFVDYSGRLRIASATSVPGQGKVDIGAQEADSAYPLVYPLIVNGSRSDLGASFTTGIAFINPSGTSTQFDFIGYDAAGGRLAGNKDPDPVSLGPHGQKATLDYQLFDFRATDSVLGSVLGSSDSKAAGFMLLVDPEFRQFATGANASTGAARDLVFMLHEQDAIRSTSYLLFNPGVNPANIEVTLYKPDGSESSREAVVVVSKGHRLLQFASGISAGYVRVKSDVPVSGVELVGEEGTFAALGGSAPNSQGRLFFPHFAVGGNYSTQVGILNTDASSSDLTLKAYDDSGSFIGSTDSVTLKPGEQLMKTVAELFDIPSDGPLRTGYLVAQCNKPGIMGFADFNYNDGFHKSDAAIPADSVTSRRLLFSHIAHGVSAGSGVPYQTGVALLNPFGREVGYTITIYDGEGTLVAQANQTIGPRQKIAKILDYPAEGVGFFAKGLGLGNGHIEVTTDYGLIGLELFFTEDLSQMASVPAQTGE